ncbi:MAG: DUF402 domain-containing protein [Planctomycetota bacterium]|jgi:protein associated with RNAse G/E|nr:DUF402 domain-containing protein [Planctomycetota bacterium]
MSAIRVTARKFDGRPHYSWDTYRLLQRDGTVLVGRAGPRDLTHHSKGKTFTFQSCACEMFWPELPFSVGLSLDAGKDHVQFYCNIHQAAAISNSAISFVDLDLDVVRRGTGPAEVVDHDEFAANAEHYGYPEAYQDSVPAIAEALRAFIDEHHACDAHALSEILLPIQNRHVFLDRALSAVIIFDRAVRTHDWPRL